MCPLNRIRSFYVFLSPTLNHSLVVAAHGQSTSQRLKGIRIEDLCNPQTKIDLISNAK